MTRELFDSFWRAAAYCLHPKVIALSLAPLAIVGGAAAALGYFYWEPALAGVRASLDESALLEPLFAWLRSIGAGGWASVLVPLVVVAVAVPVFVVATLLVAALLMTPAIVRLVAARRFPRLEARRGGSFWSGVAVSLGCTAVAARRARAEHSVLVRAAARARPAAADLGLAHLPRLRATTSSPTHASRDERVRLLDDERWPLLGMGIACGAMGAAPSLLWAVSALALVLAPFLILVSIWLYTLVFAFSSLWFAHYLLAALQRLRARRRRRRRRAAPARRRRHRGTAARTAARLCRMNIGLLIVGDEILSGKRADKHLPKVIELLAARGLALDLGALRRRRPRAHHRRPEGRVRERRPRLLVRRHRRDARRPHAPVRGGRARRAARAASRRRATS